MKKNKLDSFLFKVTLLFVLLLFSILTNNAFSQTSLTVGDIAVIGINTGGAGDDAIKLATMVDLTCGTQFIVTDNNWNSGGSWACDNDEFALEITVTSKICAGSIIYVEIEDASGPITTSSGSASKVSLAGLWGTNFGLNSGGDNVFVLTGTRATPSFIYGLKHNGAFSNSACTNRDQTGKPNELSLGSSAVVMTSGQDQWSYDCSPVSGTKATLLTDISSTSNWSSTTHSWNARVCAATQNFTLTDPCTAPTHAPVSFGSSSITQTTATISWSNCPSPGTNPGNTRVFVIGRQGSAVSTDPTSGVSYSASAVFGSGTAIGAGYVVYDGIGTSVNLSNLVAGTTYYFSVFEYSCTGNCYNINDLPGSISTLAPLGVDLLYFTATNRNESEIYFEWATARQYNHNHDHFELEGSVDGENFSTINALKGLENTEQNTQYTYLWEPNQPYHYFRLREVGLNGQSQYSTTEFLAYSQEDIELFPIPAAEELFIKINTSEVKAIGLEIQDITGALLYTSTIMPSASSFVHPIEITFLKQGTYYVMLSTDKTIHRKKFTKF